MLWVSTNQQVVMSIFYSNDLINKTEADHFRHLSDVTTRFAPGMYTQIEVAFFWFCVKAANTAHLRVVIVFACRIKFHRRH